MATDFWMELGGAKGEVARMATQYMFWTALALPGSMAARTFIAVNAAVSRPRVTMWVSLAMLALKAPLNAVFMYGLFGLPALGGGGAGISFFILTYLSLIAYWVIWNKDKFYKAFYTPSAFCSWPPGRWRSRSALRPRSSLRSRSAPGGPLWPMSA